MIKLFTKQNSVTKTKLNPISGTLSNASQAIGGGEGTKSSFLGKVKLFGWWGGLSKNLFKPWD